MEQLRIVREMRERDRADGRANEFVRPKYMLWENVDGARSSPGKGRRGEDFAAVIEEIIRICEPDSDIHVRVPDAGWPTSGCYFAEDGTWSLAWRVVDAQYFGTPQRRRRVAMLVDFNGLTAPEIMFDPQLQRATEAGEPVDFDGRLGRRSRGPRSFGEGVSGDFEERHEEGESAAPERTEGCAGEASVSYTLKIRGGLK